MSKEKIVKLPKMLSVKVECVVCKHNWVANIPFGPLPSYLECPKCLERDIKDSV